MFTKLKIEDRLLKFGCRGRESFGRCWLVGSDEYILKEHAVLSGGFGVKQSTSPSTQQKAGSSHEYPEIKWPWL